VGYYQGELELKDAIAGLERMPKQKEFVTSNAFAVSYVGGEGAGKSVALCTSCICNAVIEPKGFSLLGRLNMPALESTTMRTFLELVPADMGEFKGGNNPSWTFTNGHQVIFRHLDISDPKVTGHIRSLNLSFAGVDEQSEIPEEVFLMLTGRLRRKNVNRRIYRGSSNPAGHDWQWRYFFDPDRKPELKEMNLGIGSTSMENVFLPEEYHIRRKCLYPADWYDRFVNGSFTDFTDLIYKEFGDHTHVWDDEKEWAIFDGRSAPPLGWPVYVGTDVGGGEEGDPWALPIASLAPDGNLYQFAEIYGSELRVKPIAEQFHEKMEGRVLEGMAYDYAQRAAAIELEDYGISGQAAIKDVKPGLFKVAQYMHIDPRLVHPFTGKQGSPRYFVAKSCVNTIRELTTYKWAKDKSGNPKNEPSHANSHIPDGIRYLIHTFRPLPAELVAPKIWENPKLDVASRLYWQRVEERKEKEPLRLHRFSTLHLHAKRTAKRREIPAQ
jgi:phage terminase large subunit